MMEENSKKLFFKKIMLLVGMIASLALWYVTMGTISELSDYNGYRSSEYEFIKNGMRRIVENEYVKVKEFYAIGATASYEEMTRHSNATVLVYQNNEVVMGDPIMADYPSQWKYNYYTAGSRFEVIINDQFPIRDNFRRVYMRLEFIYTARYFIILFALVFFFGAIVFGVLFVQSAKPALNRFWNCAPIRGIRGCFDFIFGSIGRAFVHLNLTWRGVVIVGMIFFMEFFIIVCSDSREEYAFYWVLLKMVEFALAMYFTYNLRKLNEGAKALADGDLEYRTDTKKMALVMKESAQNLNHISEGMKTAVNRAVKSERFKTELITNVSHDIKTPVTSIINYANLINVEVKRADGNTLEDVNRVAEYADVLERQSKRLRKLLEDLVEASKANSGAIEVNLSPVDVGVLLSQATSEYEDRLKERSLTLVIKLPETSTLIEADGRHLWRVFDNLLSNICKYAQDDSRVYITVEPQEKGHTQIVFRNMSKYVLEASGEDFSERFFRGDKSRHMEGSGLGLAIAQSLTDIQHGTMDIVVDGDLFKVILDFPNFKVRNEE